MMYRQVTFAERYTLGLLRRDGASPAAIARVLGRHRSSISREVRRNRARSDSTYRPQLADWPGILVISHETIYRYIWADKPEECYES